MSMTQQMPGRGQGWPQGARPLGSGQMPSPGQRPLGGSMTTPQSLYSGMLTPSKTHCRESKSPAMATPSWGLPPMQFDFTAPLQEEESPAAAADSSPRKMPPASPTSPPPTAPDGPQGWQAPAGQADPARLQQIEGLRKESIIALLRPPQLDNRGQSRGNLPASSPMKTGSPVPGSLGDQPRQMPNGSPGDPARKRPSGPGQARGRFAPEDDGSQDLDVPEPLKWLLESLQSWTGLQECMEAQVDEPRIHKRPPPSGRGWPQGKRPTDVPPNASPGSARVQQQVSGGRMDQAGHIWCSRSAPGLTTKSQAPCAPANLTGLREDENGVGEHEMSGRELSQVLEGARTSMCSLKGNKNSAPNQDRAFCMGLRGGAEMFAVFDGHGECGHTVAEISCEVLPKLLLRRLAKAGALPGFPGDGGANQAYIREVMSKSFEEMHGIVEMLTSQIVDADKEPGQMDGRSSGSTGTVIMMMPGQRALVSLVGDSRAVFGRRRRGRGADDYGPWNMTELTRDHKPDLPDEQQRIEQSGAKVITVGNDHLTVTRVYTKHQSWPSINMSRSIGDLHSHTQGLSATGEVSITDRLWDPETEDAVLIVASDGIWDVLDGGMAASLVMEELQNGNDPAEGLCADALDRWVRRGLPGSYSDDITAVVKFF